MQKIPSRIRSIANICAVGVLALSGCEKPVSTPADPQAGRQCFEIHRATLPPGSQYEGAEASPGGVKIKVMDGVGIAVLECRLNPDGAMEVTGSAQ